MDVPTLCNGKTYIIGCNKFDIIPNDRDICGVTTDELGKRKTYFSAPEVRILIEPIRTKKRSYNTSEPIDNSLAKLPKIETSCSLQTRPKIGRLYDDLFKVVNGNVIIPPCTDDDVDDCDAVPSSVGAAVELMTANRCELTGNMAPKCRQKEIENLYPDNIIDPTVCPDTDDDNDAATSSSAVPVPPPLPPMIPLYTLPPLPPTPPPLPPPPPPLPPIPPPPPLPPIPPPPLPVNEATPGTLSGDGVVKTPTVVAAKSTGPPGVDQLLVRITEMEAKNRILKSTEAEWPAILAEFPSISPERMEQLRAAPQPKLLPSSDSGMQQSTTPGRPALDELMQRKMEMQVRADIMRSTNVEEEWPAILAKFPTLSLDQMNRIRDKVLNATPQRVTSSSNSPTTPKDIGKVLLDVIAMRRKDIDDDDDEGENLSESRDDLDDEEWK